MALHWLFPTPVLQVYLEPDKDAAAMEAQLKAFDRDVFEHPEFRMRNNLTGDLLGRAGLDQLHRTEAFQWLNHALAIQVESYLNSLLGPDHGLEVHIQKAWPVVCAREGARSNHIPIAMPNSVRCFMSAPRRITPVVNWNFRLQKITSAM